MSLRQRKQAQELSAQNLQKEAREAALQEPEKKKRKGSVCARRFVVLLLRYAPGKYERAREVILRFLGFLYVAVYAVVYVQGPALVGPHGLVPADSHLRTIKQHFERHGMSLYWNHPSLFWLPPLYKALVEERHDWPMNYLSLTNLVLGWLLMLFPRQVASALVLLTLWAIQLSFHSIGQIFWAFAWEMQLLELTWICAFLCPVLPPILTRFLWKEKEEKRKLLGDFEAPWAVMVILRWMLFRIMLGAGLIKLRGDPCWLDLTCMHYHYETQPIPNPLAWYLHQTPGWFHSFEVLVNHFVEVLAPLLLLLPFKTLREIGALIQIGFQCLLILSGNLAFVNYLTICPAFACFDDESFFWRLPSRLRRCFLRCVYCCGSRNRNSKQQKSKQAYEDEEKTNGSGLFSSSSSSASSSSSSSSALNALKESGSNSATTDTATVKAKDDRDILISLSSSPFRYLMLRIRCALPKTHTGWIRLVVYVLLLCAVAYLSVKPVENLMNPRQRMNISYDQFYLVNSYGFFGSITKERYEIVLSGSRDGRTWQEIEFKCKPGRLDRIPCVIAPFHLRLDWQAWFAAMQDFYHQPWILHLMVQLLKGKPQAYGLLASENPFSPESPPSFMKADYYSYNLTRWGSEEARQGYWWKRKHVMEYSPVVTLTHEPTAKWIRDTYKHLGWHWDE